MRFWNFAVTAALCSMLLSSVPVSAADAACGDAATWSLDSDGTLTIAGTGDVTSAPWLSDAGQIRSVTVAEGVTSLPEQAFLQCSNLTAVSLPDSLTSIGNCAFWMCTSLESFTIPAGVTMLGYEVFYKCDKFDAFTVSPDNTAYTAPDGILYTKDMSALVAYPKQKQDTAYTVPDGVKTIQPAAFSENPYLTSVTFSDSVETVMTSVFYNCLSLAEIAVSAGNASFVSDSGVLYTKDMTSVISCPMVLESASCTIPDGVTTIGEGAFAGVDLSEIILPDTLTTISADAFYNCEELTDITLPASLTSIGDRAFTHCTSLTEITVPASVTEIGMMAFYDCENLQTAAILDPDCDIFNDADTLPESTVLRGYADSAAQLYAEKYSRKFEEISAVLLGDVTDDSTINAEDATAVLIAAAKLGTGNDSGLDETKMQAADTTADGKINAEDATLILRYAALSGTGGTVTFEALRNGTATA